MPAAVLLISRAEWTQHVPGEGGMHWPVIVIFH